MSDQLLIYIVFAIIVAGTVLFIAFSAVLSLIKAFRGTFFGSGHGAYPTVLPQTMAAIDSQAYSRTNGNSRRGRDGMGLATVFLLIVVAMVVGITFIVAIDEGSPTGKEIARQDEDIFEPVPERTYPEPRQEQVTPERKEKKPNVTDARPQTKVSEKAGPEASSKPEIIPQPSYRDALGIYALKFGAFKDINNAFKNRDRLKAGNHKVQIVEYDDGFYRVLIYGGFNNREEVLAYKAHHTLRGIPVKL